MFVAENSGSQQVQIFKTLIYCIVNCCWSDDWTMFLLNVQNQLINYCTVTVVTVQAYSKPMAGAAKQTQAQMWFEKTQRDSVRKHCVHAGAWCSLSDVVSTATCCGANAKPHLCCRCGSVSRVRSRLWAHLWELPWLLPLPLSAWIHPERRWENMCRWKPLTVTQT